MQENTKAAEARIPHSILIVGCGLIGTSFALAVKAKKPSVKFYGVERNAQFREEATALNIFESISSDLPRDRHYELAVLAVPNRIACEQLRAAADIAELVMDVCSVKSDICKTAENLGLATSFAPSHPMAGVAASGPKAASADLFDGRTWLTIRGWDACDAIAPLITTMGARILPVDSAAFHDEAVAAVSHGIHLTSLAAMLSYTELQQQAGANWAKFCGPAFRDITRLSASPSEFWTSTLLSNREHVLGYLAALKAQLTEFETALAQNREFDLTKLLDEARSAHCSWKEESE